MQHLFVMQAGDPLSEDGLPNVKSCVSTYMPTINKVLYSNGKPLLLSSNYSFVYGIIMACWHKRNLVSIDPAQGESHTALAQIKESLI